MEATVMPATAPVQKQQGLNQVVINKVQDDRRQAGGCHGHHQPSAQ